MSETPVDAQRDANADKNRLWPLTLPAVKELRHWWRHLVLAPDVLKALKEREQWPAHVDVRPSPREWRSQLRRCTTPEAVLMTEAFRDLWDRIGREGDKGMRESIRQDNTVLLCWATIAVLVAQLDSEGSLAPGECFGRKSHETQRPLLSRSRLEQILHCRSHEELIRRMRRALRVARGEKMSAVELAILIARWSLEHGAGYPFADQHRLNRFSFTLANGYFNAGTSAPD